MSTEKIKHTPEPWIVTDKLTVTMSDFSEDVAECLLSADAERIVDCVNSMAGISKPIEYVEQQKKLIDALELLKELRRACMYLDLSNNPTYIDKDFEKKRLSSLFIRIDLVILELTPNKNGARPAETQEECKTWCGENHCDKYGCSNRKRCHVNIVPIDNEGGSNV